jgi:hypothetical protein
MAGSFKYIFFDYTISFADRNLKVTVLPVANRQHCRQTYSAIQQEAATYM